MKASSRHKNMQAPCNGFLILDGAIFENKNFHCLHITQNSEGKFKDDNKKPITKG